MCADDNGTIRAQCDVLWETERGISWASCEHDGWVTNFDSRKSLPQSPYHLRSDDDMLISRIPRNLRIYRILQRKGEDIPERRKCSKGRATRGDLGDVRLRDELGWAIDREVGREPLGGEAARNGTLSA